MRRSFWAVLVFCMAVSSANACELHPAYNAKFKKSLIRELNNVENQENLAYVIYRLILIDGETTDHEEAHYYTAQGWAEEPVYDTVELYGKKYRVGGCVSVKPGIPPEVGYLAALAPKQPSRHDLIVAEMYLMRLQELGLR